MNTSFHYFRGSVNRRISSAAPKIAAAANNIAENPDNAAITSQSSLTVPQDATRNRKISFGTSVFGSSINFGDNVPLPPINETSVPETGEPKDANWAGSCMMSLTRIPLPDVFKEVKQKRELTDEEEGKIWDRLKAEVDLNLAEKSADGIYHVPRSASLCGWWLCWRTQRKYEDDISENDELEQLKRALTESSTSIKKYKKSKLVLVRRCATLPKSMFDVLVTMMNLTLLKSFSFAIYCLASLISAVGK